MSKRAILAAGLLLAAGTVQAQQNIAHVDGQRILESMPEYQTIQQAIDKQAADWEAEIRTKQREVDNLFREYQTRELLYTNQERQRKRDEIARAEEEIERLRMQYFGPDGDLFKQQNSQIRPLQDRIVEAIEEVATRQGFDYVLDRTGDYVFLFAREQFDLTDQVLEELGIDVSRARSGSRNAN